MSKVIWESVWPEWKVEGNPLGKGSFGEVYKVVRNDHNVKSYAAVKRISIPSDSKEIDILRAEGLNFEGTKRYFQEIVNECVKEIQLMETLKGVSNIVTVEDYKVIERTNEIGWDVYIRMELLTPFDKYICNHNLTEEDIIKLGCDICAALEVCEQSNIIHRDIKPENIFVNDYGHYKLGDFGIARKMENVTGGLSQKGTYNYMAPEIMKGTRYDARVDIYSLGIVLYRLLNGNRLPFLETEQQLMNPNERRNAVERRFNGEKLPAPCEASPIMAEIIQRACEYAPERRFSSATEMKKELEYAARELEERKNTKKKKFKLFKKRVKKEKRKVGSFGDGPKKRKKIKIFLWSVIFFFLIAVFGGFVAYRWLNENGWLSNDIGEMLLSEDMSEVDKKSPEEKEIELFVEEAKELAKNSDYDAAIMKVEEGLEKYPESELLIAKLNEYKEEKRKLEINEKLEQAVEIVNAGDYLKAIDLLKDVQNTELEDEKIAKSIEVYQNEYIAGIIEQADMCLRKEEYDNAIAIIEDALKEFPDDIKLMDKLNSIQSTSPIKFIEVCRPYEKGYDVSIKDLSMSGENYVQGIVMEADDEDSWFFSNLKGEYSELEFDLGHVDNSGMKNAIVEVYLDDVLYDSYGVVSTNLPKRIKIPVENVRQLKVKTVISENELRGVPKVGLGNIVIR